MFVLYTDFGVAGPYLGQIKAVLYRDAPGIPIIDLCADSPSFDPYAAAYLLAALAPEFPPGAIFLGIVDPGVGTARKAIILHAAGRWYIGPDNGLFEIIARRAAEIHCWEITERPRRLSATFHGRDLFAPVAAQLARHNPISGITRPDNLIPGIPISWTPRPDWPDDLHAVIYHDHYGNCLTGIRRAVLAANARIAIAGHILPWANTFAEIPVGQPFVYENSLGLVEIAINQGNAATKLGLQIGAPVTIIL